MNDIIYGAGGIENPKFWLRLRCKIKYGEHYFMTPNDECQPWCGRCGLLKGGFVHLTQPKIPVPVPVLIIEKREMMRPMPPPRPIPTANLNKTIKDNVVWLVDEYKKRKGILDTVLLDDSQFDELMGGIEDVVMMYEGTYHLSRKPPEEDDEGEGNGTPHI